MSEYTATIRWQRNPQEDYLGNRYSRAHQWQFDGGLCIAASASPQIVPLPYSVAANVDPEEAFVASLSSCHMLFFLSIAAKNGLIVDHYVDQASGLINSDDPDRLWISQVTLRPRTAFLGSTPDDAELEALHHQSHDACFIANSVKTRVTIDMAELRAP